MTKHDDGDCPHGFFVGRDCKICLDDEELYALRSVRTYEQLEEAGFMTKERVFQELEKAGFRRV